MSAKRTPVTGSAARRHGIVPEHWDAFGRAASRTGYAIIVREGKPAAVPWIRKGYPAKPLSFKLKVHPEFGLLLVETDQERRQFLAHPRCFLVPLAGGQTPPAREPDSVDRLERYLVDTIRRHQDILRDPEAPVADDRLPALVVDRQSGLPFTSDYDLAAVIDTQYPHYEVTFMSHGSLGESKSRTNGLVDALTRHLNQEFGTERIQHGAEAQYSGQAANKDDEGLILFRPEGRAEFMLGGSAVESWQLIRDVMTEYHPEMADSFNN
jgi:hypothetical protein